MILRDKKFRRPTLTLVLITPVLTELLSGNIPAQQFFLPWVYFFLMIAYGLPAMVLRELYIVWNLKFPGLFLLGLVYGIYNEGVLARTLLRSENVPINAFDHYTWLGVNFPWAALIVPWHAFHAIVFPIALVTMWFPSAAQESWISRRSFWWITTLLTGFGMVIFLLSQPHGPPIYLAFFIAVMGLFIWLAKKMRHNRPDPFLEARGAAGWRPVLAGALLYPVLVLGLSLCAGFRLNGVLICGIAVLILWAYFQWLRRKDWLRLTPFVLFALGDYFSGAWLTGLFQWKNFPLGPLTGAILAGIFAWHIGAILKSDREQRQAE